jgi:DNA-3-methyladenine glycosylase
VPESDPIVPAALLAHAFFERPTADVARDLLGKFIVSRGASAEANACADSATTTPAAEVTVTGGRIVETEAYLGSDDAGSHAATRGVTPRNRVMYGPPGHAYVYFTYGMHHMLNLIAEEEGTAGGVLIRSFEPLFGVDLMTSRRNGRPLRELASGPGRVAAALGVTLDDNGVPLDGTRLGVYDGPAPVGRIGVSGRIGLSAGHELDLRFFIENDPFVSKARTGPGERG